MPLWPPAAVVPSPHEPPPPPDFHPPLRPSFGRIGRPILLRANHFQVKIPNCVLYHYDISIVPDKCPRRVNREIVEALVMSQAQYFAHQKLVFDGRKNLYSRRPLPIGRDRVSHIHLLHMYPCVHLQGLGIVKRRRKLTVRKFGVHGTAPRGLGTRVGQLPMLLYIIHKLYRGLGACSQETLDPLRSHFQ